MDSIDTRFLEWTQVNTVSFSPTDDLVVVGAFNLAEQADTLWIRITQINPSSQNNFAYGIVSWQSDNGRELGSTKAYGTTVGEVFQLPVTKAPGSRQGSIVFMPRLYNLKWIRDNNINWRLSFAAASGRLNSPAANNGTNAVSGVVGDSDGNLARFRLQANGLAILTSTD